MSTKLIESMSMDLPDSVVLNELKQVSIVLIALHFGVRPTCLASDSCVYTVILLLVDMHCYFLVMLYFSAPCDYINT